MIFVVLFFMVIAPVGFFTWFLWYRRNVVSRYDGFVALGVISALILTGAFLPSLFAQTIPPPPNTFCQITQAGVVVRAPAYAEQSCAEWRLTVAQKTFDKNSPTQQKLGVVWLCYLLDPCAQEGK